MMHDNQNIMVVLSSPSGAGKTTITKKIQQKFSSFKISVSHTTRKPRPNEVNGVDYHFVNSEKFKFLINENKLYEYAKIFDNYYGTSKEIVDNLIKTNDIIFDIDWQGNQQLSKYKNLNLVKIFITTKNKEEVKSRLMKRNQDSKEEVKKRLKSFEEDIKHWDDYDYIVTNDDLENCIANKKVLYDGHAVAAVAAIDEKTAKNALKLIRVDFEELPFVIDVDHAMKKDAPVVQTGRKRKNVPDNFSDNVTSYCSFGHGNLDDGYNLADKVIEKTFKRKSWDLHVMFLIESFIQTPLSYFNHFFES